MDYFIGVDIGTSSARAVAFSDDGKVLAQHAVGYGISHPKADWSEQDPYEISEVVINCITEIGHKLLGNKPVLISFSAAMHSLVAVDTEGRPLTNCIIWADNRAVEIAERLRYTELGQSFYHKTGVPVHAMSPMCKLKWLKENQVDIFTGTYKFIGIKEFIFHSLFGKYIVDTGIASATGLFNIHTRLWDDTILEFTGINKCQLSELVSAQHVEFLNPEFALAGKLHLFSKTAFVVGGSDGGLANLGSGAIAADSMAITIGTSGAARMVSQEVFTDEQMRTFCYHLKEETYITGGASNNGAIVLQWLKNNILESDESIEAFFSLASTVPPGSNQLIFLPYVLGERAPLWNSNARGVLFGLSIMHSKAHLVRAAMEAVVYNLYSIGKVLMERSKVTTIYANGGFANSPLWIQMLADMFNVKVMASGIEESSAWGAVLVGMEALGKGIPVEASIASGKKYEPDQDTHLLYLRYFEKFERISNLLKSEFIWAEEGDIILEQELPAGDSSFIIQV